MTSLVQRLGLPLHDDLALADLIESGLPASALTEARKAFRLPSTSSVAALIGISARTAQLRVAQRSKLARGASERMVRLIRIHNQAVETFESEENALRWLQKPLAMFDDRAPLELLTTEPGARAVEQVLGRIEHGIHG